MNNRLRIFFLLQRLIGSRADHRYHDFLRMERWSKEKLEGWREQSIRSLLDHAVEKTSYYKTAGLSSDAPLSAFPIMTKKMLHEHYHQIMTEKLREEYTAGKCKKRYGWLEITSGGTTGIPTTVIHDTDFRDMDRAARLYEQHLCGFPFGTNHLRLWGSMADIQQAKASRAKKIMAWLANETLLNAFMMEDDQIDQHIKLFKDTSCDYMIAYVDALEQIANYAHTHGITLPSFVSMITTGGTLTEDTETFLRNTFSARIHNKYGSRDCGELACACEKGRLHVLSPNIHIEILDDDNKPVEQGESGRVICTFLGNYAFPIIRFEIGDIAVSGPEECACGRSFPTLERVTARTVDMIRSTSGGFVTPVYIRHVIGVVHGQRKFRRYQFIQQDRTRYELFIQPESGLDSRALNSVIPHLKHDLLEILGHDANLDIHFEEHIQETASGKVRYVINNCKAEL